VGVQREVEVGLQRRLRRELQVEPLIICLVQPAPAGTPAYKGRADAEPDSRPAPRGRSARDGGARDGVGRGRDGSVPAPQRQLVAVGAADPAVATPVSAPAVVPTTAVAEVPAPAPAELEPELAGRTRRRRSAAIAG
jgi:ribonuclease J